MTEEAPEDRVAELEAALDAAQARADGLEEQIRAAAQRVKSGLHELRQPLQAMRLFLFLLGKKLEAAEERQLLERLDQSLDAVEETLKAIGEARRDGSPQ